MKKLLLAVLVSVFFFAPPAALAQDAETDAPERAVVVLTKFKAPLTEEGAKVRQFIREFFAPMQAANPHIQDFYVLNHLYGADARDIMLVSVYANFADVEAPCGEPCRALMETMPEPDTPEGDEYQELMELFSKYYADHSDEVFSSWSGGVPD